MEVIRRYLAYLGFSNREERAGRERGQRTGPPAGAGPEIRWYGAGAVCRRKKTS